MPIAAVPAYLGNDFKDASPGMRFGLLLPIWTNRQDQEMEVRKRAEARSREGQEVANLLQTQGMDATIRHLRQRQQRPLPGLWDKNDFAARKAWDLVKTLTASDQLRMKQLANRQTALAGTVTPDRLLCLAATATAPFTTGLGNEHPLENGFAFLWPYGLPYLPGSGVKGVVRRAAQELASGMWDNDRGWKGLDQRCCYRIEYGSGKNRVTLDLSVLDVLFGYEPEKGDAEHVRGALSFWDVIPQIKGDSLMVEIMTPHQGHYYQQKQEKKSGDSTSPHDSGQPTPIPFLTVPPGSIFTFYVVCDVQHLERLTQDGAPDLLMPGEDGKPKWQTLLEAAFEHAFKWLGFGAKTAVGYGAMRKNGAQEQALQDAKPSADEAIWHQANLEFRPNTGEIIASFRDQKTAPVKGDLAQAILDQLEPAQRERLKKKKSLKDVSVRVRIKSNLIELLGLQP
jgi:CRISPR-associated protein Cmr6